MFNIHNTYLCICKYYVYISICISEVLEKWLGKEGLGPAQFDSIDMTNRHGEEKVLFKVEREITAITDKRTDGQGAI